MSGRVVHFEIPADNLDRARGFYREAFGWKVDTVPGMDYTMAMSTPADEQGMPTEPGAINGGMFQREADLNVPVITIEVDNLDEALERIPALGGTIVRGKDTVADMGFTGYFTDTEGNLVGLWQNATPAG